MVRAYCLLRYAYVMSLTRRHLYMKIECEINAVSGCAMKQKGEMHDVSMIPSIVIMSTWWFAAVEDEAVIGNPPSLFATSWFEIELLGLWTGTYSDLLLQISLNSDAFRCRKAGVVESFEEAQGGLFTLRWKTSPSLIFTDLLTSTWDSDSRSVQAQQMHFGEYFEDLRVATGERSTRCRVLNTTSRIWVHPSRWSEYCLVTSVWDVNHLALGYVTSSTWIFVHSAEVLLHDVHRLQRSLNDTVD